jgi:predicted metalloendopeptidase
MHYNYVKRNVTKRNTTNKSHKSTIKTGLGSQQFEFERFEKKYESNNKTKKNQNIQRNIIKLLHKPFTSSNINAKDDYYTYINYNWLKDITTKSKTFSKKDKYYVQVDDFRVLQDKVYKELIEIVEDYIKTNNTKKSKMIGNVYNSLSHLNTSYTKKHVHLFEEFHNKYMGEGDLSKYLAYVNSNEIVSWGCPIVWSMLPDEKNSRVYTNTISLPQLSLYDVLLYFDDTGQERSYIKYKHKVKREYLKYIDEIFDSCLGKNHGLKSLDVFTIEKELLDATGCLTIKNDSDDFYNVVTSEESLEKYGFDWEKFCLFLGYDKIPKTFICSSLNYLKCVCALLKDNWNSQKWKSYWYYIHLRQLIRFDKNLRTISFKFNKRFIEGQVAIFPREIFPIFGLSLTFNSFLTEEYERKFRNENNIKYVENMGYDLIHVFKRIIKRNTWMSAKTKEYALLKLEHLTLTIARPSVIRDDPLLEYHPEDAWGNMRKLCDWKTSKYLKLLNNEVIDIPIIDWNEFKLIGQQAYVVNAYYTPTLNSIYIPLAYLQKPFIDMNERGIEYNLSHVGYTLAHEMSHALDENGSKYDHKGNLHNWWSPQDKIKYKRIIHDIIKQYERFASYDGIKFDASIGIGEDMADISGLAICTEYLIDFQNKNEDLIPIRSLSCQAFMVYFAMQQRQFIYKKAINAQLKTNPHPLDKYRTNVPLSRLELFRSIYNIKKGDKMWWPSTNTIW